MKRILLQMKQNWEPTFSIANREINKFGESWKRSDHAFCGPSGVIGSARRKT